MEAIGKKKGCEGISLWVASIKHHVYWCAASSNGDKDLIREKWLSIINHLLNIHEGHRKHYPKCMHEEIERQWLKEGK